MNATAAASRTDSRPPDADLAELREAMRFCRELTRRRARNFYYGLKLTPEPRRSALYAVYAFMRRCDDLADDALLHADVPEAMNQIESFRETMVDVLAGAEPPEHDRPLWIAFRHVMRRYPIDPRHMHGMLDGQAADVKKHVYETFDQLQRYCYHVAGTVGLVCTAVWGAAPDERTREMAVQRGLAFQLTNILRDVVEDATMGRQYLPTEDFERFGCDPAVLISGRADESFDRLMRFEIDRARSAYEGSAALESRLAPECRATARALARIYRELLEKIASDPRRVLKGRMSLSPVRKVWIGLSSRVA